MLHFFAKIIALYIFFINASCSNSAQKPPNEGNESGGGNGQETYPRNDPSTGNDPSISEAAKLLGIATNKYISLNDITKEFGKKLFDNNTKEEREKVEITEKIMDVFLADKDNIPKLIDIFNYLLDENYYNARVVQGVLSELDHKQYIDPIIKYINDNNNLSDLFRRVLENLEVDAEKKGDNA